MVKERSQQQRTRTALYVLALASSLAILPLPTRSTLVVAALTTRPLLFTPLLPSIFFRLLSVEKREQLILPLGFRHWARRAIDVPVALSTFWSRAASPLDCHQFTRVLNDCGCSALLSDLRLQLDLPTENTTLGSRRRQYLPGDARVRVGN